MLPLGPKFLLCLIALFIPSDWSLLGVNGQRGDETTQETFTDDPNLVVNDPPTDDTVLVDVAPSIDDQAISSDKNTSAECREEQFTCTRLYSVYRPVKQCIHQQLCIVNVRRKYIVNKEICSRLICKEHEVMKDELCRQIAGLPPRRLQRSNYFRLPVCDDVEGERPNGL
ncbi:microfibrillar-associated protein 5 [Trichosurus vulpecula]|uniref:microfibrillar-associated protein 5 n=1 Tax=Trichosurus vulpecula TaxID=9337 RepID=UPI00186AE6B0|nr:microfibrillar-associated protein 5 [Trichosurus vulpecula]XP_036617993.1 microfibrillar-associated protein 5 [Trichosurus vulpecula]